MRKFCSLPSLCALLMIAGAILLLNSCKKQLNCTDEVPISPYTDPVWYPNGQILGFNRLPLKAVLTDQTICRGYSYNFYDDSSGFWLVSKDGSNLRRATAFQLLDPSWSPDGNWIAFCNGGTIYKMGFDGNKFDTADKIALTSNGASNYSPSWSPTGDTIYFESNKDAPSGTDFYSIWKIASDGNGEKRVCQSSGVGDTREPYCVSGEEILHIRYAGEVQQVFSMDTNGDSVMQITTNVYANSYSQKEYPKYYNGTIYFEDFGIWSINRDGSGLRQLSVGSVDNFSISNQGAIAYINFDFTKVDKTLGTVWTMDLDGTNKKQLTFNYY